MTRTRLALLILRATVALLLLAHGVARVAVAGVAPFGGFLTSAGFPFGSALAWGITIFEIAGSAALAGGLWVVPISIVSAIHLLMGIVLVHGKAGWFVVGPGHNGSEYNVLLIAALATVALAHGEQKRTQIAPDDPDE